jgi:phosphonate transport system substrate-binding protein
MRKWGWLLTVFPVFMWSCFSKPNVKIDYTNRIHVAAADTLSINTNKIGIAAMLSPTEAFPVYDEIVTYMGDKMNYDFEIVFTKDYASMNNLVKKKQVLAAFVCSGPYVEGHKDWGMELIVAPSFNGSAHYYSYIIVNKNSPISTLKELKGKKFAFTDPESNTGRLVPTFEFMKMGRNPENYFSEIIYTGSHDKSIEAVAKNLVEGASVDNLIWEYMNSSGSVFTSRTKIIAQFGPFASPPFVTHPDCDTALKNKMKSILLHMHEDSIGKPILNELRIDKFVIIDDTCYESVRRMQQWIKEQKNDNYPV